MPKSQKKQPEHGSGVQPFDEGSAAGGLQRGRLERGRLERGRLERGSAAAFLGTMVSRISGLVRDIVVSASFAPQITDPFYLVFQIPNTVRGLLAEGAVNAAFLPSFSRIKQQHSEAEAKKFAAAFSGAMSLALGVVTLLGVVSAPLLIQLYAPGYHQGEQWFASKLLRVFFPYLMFIGAAAFSQAMLNLYGHFLLPSAASAMLNLGQISACVWLWAFVSPEQSELRLLVLTGGAVFGAFLQWLVQVVYSRWRGCAVRPVVMQHGRFAFLDPDVRAALRLLLPVSVGLGVVQLNVLLSRLFASYLPDGSQSYLYYAQRLVEIPQGLFAISVASASMPLLSEKFAERDLRAAFQLTERALRMTLVLAIPSAMVLWLFGADILRIVFQRGSFSDRDVANTSAVLSAFALGVVPISWIRNLAQVAYAVRRPRVPLAASAVNLAVFLLLGFFGSRLFGLLGLAYAMSVAACVQLAVLMLVLPSLFRGDVGEDAQSANRVDVGTWRRFVVDSTLLAARIVVATGLAYFCSVGMDRVFWSAPDLTAPLPKSLLQSLFGLLTFAVFWPLVAFFAIPEARPLGAALARKLGRR